MSKPDIVVIGASAGGIEALLNLFSRLPADLPAAFFVVVHLPANASSALPRILKRAGKHVCDPRDGGEVRHGCVYVAPPDMHMILRDNAISLVSGPRENGCRPAIDPLFRSAAGAYGPRVVGVLLSGLLDDGTQGLASIKNSGGLTIAQDPDEALHPSMPSSAIAHVGVHHVLPVAGIAQLLVQLITGATVSRKGKGEPQPAMEEQAPEEGMEATGLTCPDCGGVIWERTGGAKPWYQCRVGHAFSEASLEAHQTESVEAALWAAARLLEEKEALSRRIAARLRKRRSLQAAEEFERRAEASAANARAIRSLLTRPSENGSEKTSDGSQ